jgi:group I intron endonuclease
MAYIYMITNEINGKVYVGKTEESIQKRFVEHCADSKKERNKNRPLYRAMNKYGVENFTIHLLEETD